MERGHTASFAPVVSAAVARMCVCRKQEEKCPSAWTSKLVCGQSVSIRASSHRPRWSVGVQGCVRESFLPNRSSACCGPSVNSCTYTAESLAGVCTRIAHRCKHVFT
eukprot:4879947-Pleurochrysis_carterae.AAC.1